MFRLVPRQILISNLLLYEISNKRFLSILRPSSFFVDYSSENRLCCSVKSCVVRTNPSWLVLSRNKYMGKGKRLAKMEDEESSDEENEDEDDDGENANVRTFSVSAPRCDLILKSVLRISRRTIEEHFYENKIRVNGVRLMKKSQNVSVGDEVDVIKNFISDSNHLTIDRVQIIEIKPNKETGKILVKATSYKSLKVKNYTDVNSYKEID